jgi:hypothetical protein
MADAGGSANGDYSNLVEEDLFKLLLHLELQKAVRLQYCVSVVCLTPDLPPASLDRALAKKIAETAVRQLRGTDVATAFSAGPSVGLLLIDADTRTLPQILERAREGARVAVQAHGGTDQEVSLSAGAGCYPETATTGRDLLRQATDLMVRARAEGGDRFYLPT